MASPPTAKQLRYLRALAHRTGTTFTPPRTAREASQAIRMLRQRPVATDYEREADADSVTQRHGASCGFDIHDDELDGWGAECRWSDSTREQ